MEKRLGWTIDLFLTSPFEYDEARFGVLDRRKEW